MKAFAVMGGTFDPVHNGHLQTAREACDQLGVDTVILIPSRQPPHRSVPGRSPEQRLAMLMLAVQDDPRLVVDDRELHRPGPSFTVDTLESLREQLGPHPSVSMMLGLDAFALLPSWHRWQDVLALVNVVVLDRPGHKDLPQALIDLTAERLQSAKSLPNISHGAIARIRTTQLAISSTHIRAELAAGRDIDDLVPATVSSYIRDHQLYV